MRGEGGGGVSSKRGDGKGEKGGRGTQRPRFVCNLIGLK